MDVFPASSNFAESLVRGRAQRFSERLAKAYPTRTAVMLKQAASHCIQTTGFDRAALILEVGLGQAPDFHDRMC